MKLTNIAGYETIDEYVIEKLNKFSNEEKNFSRLFEYMFSESENVMAEISDGYRISKTTYGDVKDMILRKASALSALLGQERGIVGIYMDNSLDWIKIFWSVLVCGCTPLLMNKRLPKEVLENILTNRNVRAVISDGEAFCVRTIDCSELTEDGEPIVLPRKFGEDVIFMSSGTTQNIKLCVYTAENFFYQIANSVDIVKNCPQISSHFEGELKLLTLLPFYHIFGFSAVYLWFGFFSRTFVFLRDMTPNTIQNTVKKHKVTHIFAVPMVWEKVYKTVIATAKRKGNGTYRKLIKGIKLSNSNTLMRRLLNKQLSQVREQIFGDSIKFLISGGGYISEDVLSFYNGIGYYIVNGYGMTEVGITSVEISSKAKIRNKGSIGNPFLYTQYSLNDNGQLLIKGRNMASRIYQHDSETVVDYDAWFNSGDLACKTKNGYSLLGRSDDLIISNSGENINPLLTEACLKIDGAESLCLLKANSQIMLLIGSKQCYSPARTANILDSAKSELEKIGLIHEIDRIYLTPDALISEGDFKISRKKLAKRIEGGELILINEATHASSSSEPLGALEKSIIKMFADVLQKSESEVAPDDNFFTVLGGSSLEYFILADTVAEQFTIDIKAADGKSLHTVNEICQYIKNN